MFGGTKLTQQLAADGIHNLHSDAFCRCFDVLRKSQPEQQGPALNEIAKQATIACRSDSLLDPQILYCAVYRSYHGDKFGDSIAKILATAVEKADVSFGACLKALHQQESPLGEAIKVKIINDSRYSDMSLADKLEQTATVLGMTRAIVIFARQLAENKQLAASIPLSEWVKVWQDPSTTITATDLATEVISENGDFKFICQLLETNKRDGNNCKWHDLLACRAVGLANSLTELNLVSIAVGGIFYSGDVSGKRLTAKASDIMDVSLEECLSVLPAAKNGCLSADEIVEKIRAFLDKEEETATPE